MAIEIQVLNPFNSMGGCSSFIKQLKQIQSKSINYSFLIKQNTSHKVYFEMMAVLKVTYLSLRNSLKTTLIIHMFSNVGVLRDALFVFLSKNPILLLAGNLSFHLKNKPWIYKILIEYSLKNASVVLCLNHISLEAAREFNSNSVLIKNFIVPSFYGVEKIKNDKFDSKEFDFIYHGRFTESKGTPQIIRIAEKMPDKQFLVVGNGQKEFIAKLRSKLNIKLCLSAEFPGEIGNLLTKARIYIFPSKREGGTPYSLLEAMLFGLPLVVNNYPSSEELVTENNGIIVPFEEVDRVVSVLYDLLDAPERILNYSKFNYNQIQEEYNYDHFEQTLLEALYRINIGRHHSK